jgi:hypothetical protein
VISNTDISNMVIEWVSLSMISHIQIFWYDTAAPNHLLQIPLYVFLILKMSKFGYSNITRDVIIYKCSL